MLMLDAQQLLRNLCCSIVTKPANLQVSKHAYTHGQKSLHIFEPLFSQLLVVRDNNKLHPKNCIEQSNNTSKTQGERIIIWQVRVGQNVGYKKPFF